MSGVWHLVLVYSDVGAVVGCVHSLLCSDSSSINASFPRLSVIICYFFFLLFIGIFFLYFIFFLHFIYLLLFFATVVKKSIMITLKKTWKQ